MGAHKNPRRLVTLPAEEFEYYDQFLEGTGLSWSEWVVGLMRSACPPRKGNDEKPDTTDSG